MRRSLWCLLALLLALLCACSAGEPEERSVKYMGTTYAIDTETETITSGGLAYRYQIRGDRVEFTYPDGSTYYWQQQGNIGSGGWSEDYDPQAGGYAPGETLWHVLELQGLLEQESGVDGGWMLLGLLLVGIGGVNVAVPASMWYLSYGWRYRNAEPSDAALVVQRLSGVAACVVGIVLILFAF